MLLFALISICLLFTAHALTGVFEIMGIMGKGLADFELCVTEASAECIGTKAASNTTGVAVLDVSKDSNFVVRAQHRPAYQDLYVFGNSGDVDFRYPTFMGTKFEARALAALMLRPYNASLGTLVVGMDVRVGNELQPAIGATAVVRGIRGEKPFILYDGFIPRAGQSVIPRGSSWVTWTNMEPNVSGIVEVTPPKGMQCFVSPGLSSKLLNIQMSIFADSVTLVSFICEKTALPAVVV